MAPKSNIVSYLDLIRYTLAPLELFKYIFNAHVIQFYTTVFFYCYLLAPTLFVNCFLPLVTFNTNCIEWYKILYNCKGDAHSQARSPSCYPRASHVMGGGLQAPQLLGLL